jgi:NTP pyrophosphatase (non-canonical NTP hydrolase)
MSDIKEITAIINKFVDERDWRRYHNHKDLALSMLLEAAEVLEHFQWQTPDEAAVYAKAHKEAIADELADVTSYLFELACIMDIDLKTAVLRKMKKNAIKYPIAKAKGRHTKYTKLQESEPLMKKRQRTSNSLRARPSDTREKGRSGR